MPLDRLPEYSPWPARLLGFTSFPQVQRTLEKVEAEYNRDKYGALLAFLRDNPETDFEELRQYEMNSALNRDQICISEGEDLFLMASDMARKTFSQWVTSVVDEACTSMGISTVVELGAGWGYNLYLLKTRIPDLDYWGGEYAENAVKVAQLLSRRHTSVRVLRFNFYDREDYDFLAHLRKPVLVMTCHALEQLPSCATVFEYLGRYRDTVAQVIHFEAAYELHNDTLLGMMRKRYAQVNDYNRDLLSSLKTAKDVEILEIQPHVMGLNSLNPTSLIRWGWRVS